MPDQLVSDVDRTVLHTIEANETLEDDEEIGLPSHTGDQTVIGPKWIGNIRCFWHNKDGEPRITIGPNWGFTIGLGFLVSGALYVSITGLIGMIKAQAAWYYILGGVTSITLGLAAFFACLLGDPGIPAEIYYQRARPLARP